MAEVMSGPDPVVEDYCEGEFAVTTIRPRVAGDSPYIAVSEERQVIVGFSGYLYAEDIEQRRRPAHHCLKLYEDLGTEFARELNGSFAIVIYDRQAEKLLLITDRLSSRALYYSFQKDFVFASEVKAILQYPGVSRKVNKDRLCEFLAVRYVLGRDTYYDHIRQVPSASVLVWDGVEPHFVKYWEPRFTWSHDCDIRELADRAVSALRGAVRRSCLGAERPGLMLSGGLDSRAIATTSDQDLLCMTMHSDEGYEVATARRVAKALGYQHMFVKLRDTYPLELLEGGSLIGDGMHEFYHAQPLSLRELLRTHNVDILLNGWGLEFYFSGRYLPARTLEVCGKKCTLPVPVSPDGFSVSDHIIRYWQAGTGESLSLALDSYSEREIIHGLQARLDNIVSEYASNVQSKYDAVDWIIAPSNMAKYPSYSHVFCVDWLVPAGMPAHDNEVIDAFLATPPYYRFSHRIYAHMYKLLNSSLRRIPYTMTGVPLSTNAWWEFVRSALDRKVVRPVTRGVRRLVDRSYKEPVRTAWPRPGQAMRQCDEWRQTLWARASHSYLADLGVISGDGVRTLIEQHLSGKYDRSGLLGAWLTLEEWLRHYG